MLGNSVHIQNSVKSILRDVHMFVHIFMHNCRCDAPFLYTSQSSYIQFVKPYILHPYEAAVLTHTLITANPSVQQ